MKIGIIGAGHIGAGLAKRLVVLGHEVAIANSRGPESLKAVAADTGARPESVTDVVKGPAVIVIAIPEKSVLSLPTGLFRDVPTSVVVADTGNYYPGRDGVIAELESLALTESEWVAKTIGRPVLKVFNNILSQSLVARGRPKGVSGRIALPLAGDDRQGKDVLSGLVDALGFDPIDGGSLAESWRQQPGTPVYCTDLDAANATRALQSAVRSASPGQRDRSWKEFVSNPGLSHDEVLKRIRALHPKAP